VYLGVAILCFSVQVDFHSVLFCEPNITPILRYSVFVPAPGTTLAVTISQKCAAGRPFLTQNWEGRFFAFQILISDIFCGGYFHIFFVNTARAG
jgi:hypothetical protein